MTRSSTRRASTCTRWPLITYHTLHGATTVTIPEDVVVDGQVVTKAGTYEYQNDGKYWTGFDRTDPIQGAARGEDLDRRRPSRSSAPSASEA